MGERLTGGSAARRFITMTLAIVLARSDDFADALTGSQLAARLGGPLLLTPPSGVPPDVMDAIDRYGVAEETVVYLMGGEAALSAAVEAQLRSFSYPVQRIAGRTRYETAVLAAEVRREVEASPVLIADGDSFPYALISSAAAGRTGAVVLTAGTRPVDVTSAYLEDVPSPVVRLTVGEAAATAYPGHERIASSDPYDTSRLLAERFFDDPEAVGLASGERFPDGLAGGSHAGFLGFPLLLSPQAELTPRVAQYLAGQTSESAPGALDAAYLYGGTAALSDRVAAQVGRLAFYLDCGVITCSMYVSRGATRALCDAICDDRGAVERGNTTIASAGCFAAGAGAVGAAVCGVVAHGLTSDFFNALEAGAQDGNCVRLRHSIVGGTHIPLSANVSDNEVCDFASGAVDQ